MLKAVLFDLDGTLLPMDQDIFIKTYFGGISKHLIQYGYEPEKLINGIWSATNSVIKNDGKLSNEEMFWSKFSELYDRDVRADEPYFEEFYVKHFDKIREVCGSNEKSRSTVAKIREMGLVTALATNPVFPRIATEKRMAWVDLLPEDFALFTTYENSHYCKPNPKYYLEIAEKLGLSPEGCLMVGNDISEDMVAKDIGMKVFLLPMCLINKEGKDINEYPHGDFEDLLEYIENNR